MQRVVTNVAFMVVLLFGCSTGNCPDLGGQPYRTISTSDTSPGVIVTAQCDTGYRFQDGRDTMIVKCSSQDTWSEPVTDCAANRCPPIYDVGNATASGGIVNEGAVIIYTCEPIYHFPDMSQSKAIKCLTSGVWNSTQLPDCEVDCGFQAITPLYSQVVGGEESVPHSWPWMIHLLHGNYNWGGICGGTLIAAQWVATAAHCVWEGSGQWIYEPSDFRVKLGQHQVYSSESSIITMNVVRVVVHPSYTPYDSDIALLQLESPVPFANEILPCCLAEIEFPVNVSCLAVGWGTTHDTGDNTFLQQAFLPPVDQSVCAGAYGGGLTDNMYCAGYMEGGKDTCQGDSGGPHMCLVDGAWRLYGITSHGNGCAQPGYPGVYTKILPFRNWIDTTLQGEVCSAQETVNILEKHKGYVSSPSYPSDYPGSSNCNWQLLTIPGMRLDLTFKVLNTEYETNCGYDKVEIVADGATHTFCGNSLPPMIQTLGDSADLLFTSDVAISGQGFLLEYAPRCDFVINAVAGSSGEIISPNYPGLYPNSMDCTWNIETPENYMISVTFLNLDLEPSATCSYDRVKIYDGNTTSSRLVTEVCGTTVPPQFESADSSLLITFHSDYSVPKSGFRLTYSILLNSCQNGVVFHRNPKLLSQYTLQSLHFPTYYEDNADCAWLIQSSGLQVIELTFITLDIEESTDCTNDRLNLYDGPDTTAPLLGSYCGTSLPSPLPSASSTIYATFTSNADTNRPGFQIEYITYVPGCQRLPISGGHGTTGVLTSPGFPSNYPNSAICEYLVNGDPNHIVDLTLDSFILESGSCSWDSLSIYDGVDKTGLLVGKFCGTTYPSHVITTTSSLYMKFSSDSSINRPGFQATYVIVLPGCPLGELAAEDGVTGTVSSPSYPNQYPNSVSCPYKIVATPGRGIEVTFLTFDIDCGGDSLQVYDGEDTSAALLANLCGSSIPASITTSGSSLYLVFSSDSSTTANGFNLTFTAADPATTTTTTSTTQTTTTTKKPKPRFGFQDTPAPTQKNPPPSGEDEDDNEDGVPPVHRVLQGRSSTMVVLSAWLLLAIGWGAANMAD